MRVIDPGHHYELGVFDDTGEGNFSFLRFVKRFGSGYPNNKLPTYPGTNCQEVIRVLIDRVKYLNNQIPHEQNLAILTSLRSALTAFETRAAERHGRQLALTNPHIEDEPTCFRCGHVGCAQLCKPHFTGPTP